MSKKLYVGNLSYKCTDHDLAELFSAYGEVIENGARVITDRETGRSKGFGFVEMKNDDEAKNAINELNQRDYLGRPLTVNEARPRENTGPRNNRDGARHYSNR